MVEENERSTKKYLTPKEVSDILGIGIKGTYKLFNLRGFPRIKIGRRLFVRPESLEEYLSRHEESKLNFF